MQYSISNKLIFRNVKSAASILLLVFLASCGEQKPLITVKLEVTPSGAYILAGQRVALDKLERELITLKTLQPSVELHVLASASANAQSVSKAIATAQNASISRLRVETVSDLPK